MTVPALNLVNVLRATCAVLALAVAWQVFAPLSLPSAVTVQPMTVPGFKIVSPALMPAASQFAALADRPVFNPDRKPFVEKQEVEETTVTPPQVTLLGIIADGERRLALVRATDFPFATSVSVGQMIGGWQVSEIDAVSIVLRAGQQVEQVGLNAPAVDTGTSLPSPSIGAPQQQGQNTK